jgi:hypothetical protein
VDLVLGNLDGAGQRDLLGITSSGRSLPPKRGPT